jgi:hypothetical protein
MLSGGVLTKDMQENLNKLVMQPLTAEERSLLGGTLPTDHAQEPDSIQFSVPLRGDLHSGADPVMKVVCGGQHIALLTASGALYTVGAGSACGLDAQSAVRAAEKFVERGMGGASRQETIAIVREAGAGHKVPTRVGVEVGGKRMRVLDVSCGLKHMVVAIADEEDIEVAASGDTGAEGVGVGGGGGGDDTASVAGSLDDGGAATARRGRGGGRRGVETHVFSVGGGSGRRAGSQSSGFTEVKDLRRHDHAVRCV